jgi:hypothetical protein
MTDNNDGQSLREMVEADRQKRQEEAGERIAAILDELNCRLDYIETRVNGRLVEPGRIAVIAN